MAKAIEEKETLALKLEAAQRHQDTTKSSVSMKAVLQNHGQTLRLRTETLPVLLMSYEWRAKVEPGSGKHSVYTHFPKDSNCDICLKTNNEGFLQKTHWYNRAQSGKLLGDLITPDHKILSEESELRNNHRYAVVAQDLAISDCNPTRARQKLPRKPRRT